MKLENSTRNLHRDFVMILFLGVVRQVAEYARGKRRCYEVRTLALTRNLLTEVKGARERAG